VRTTYTYEPFGTASATGQSNTNPYQYTGRENDGTGLDDYRARYYSPSRQRFISEDPIGFVGGELDLYVYARNSPLNFLDSLGLTSLTYDVSGRVLTVDPERRGEAPYTIPASSGVGACMNQPKCAAVQNRGPIPLGSYRINTSEISEPGPIWSIVRNLFGDWGSFRVPIHPLPGGAVPGGRSGFFLHGGSKPGSAGCIDVGGGISGTDITRRLLRDLRGDPDGIVPLTVR
jgi:RHS repeat-associated protein